MRLAGFEAKKLFLRLPVLLALILFTALDMVKIHGTLTALSWLHGEEDWRRVYWAEYGKYSGEITLEKINALLEVYRPLEEVTNDLTATTRADVEGTLTGNLYSDRNLLERYYVSPMRRFYEYESDAALVVRQARENVGFYVNLGNMYEARKNLQIAKIFEGRRVDEFHFTEGVKFAVHYDFSTVLIFLLLLYGLSQGFSRDRECRMTELIGTSVKGHRSTDGAKLLAATGYILAVSLWFSAADLLGFAVFSDITDAAGMPVYAVGGFGESSLGLTVSGYFAVSALTRALGFWALGTVFLALGRLGRNALLPFAAGAGVFLACTLAWARWGYSSAAWLKTLNIFSLLANRVLFGETEFVNVLGRPVLTWKVSLVWGALTGTLASAAVMAERGRGRPV